jgi:two-component system LytT family response regulator
MSAPIRALLVDDEQPARERLRRLLGEVQDVDVVGEAEDGEQAMAEIARLAPGVVFLDIQMPGCTGMEVAASLPAPRPHIVFCTAFDQYAVDAFELSAVDYLLKPINRARLEKALDRVRRGAGSDDAIDSAMRTSTRPTRFLARRGATYRVVQAREVLCFLSEEGITKLQTAEQHYWMTPTLNELESRLDERQFFRISRASIVNLDAVREVTPTAGGHGEIALRDGSKHEVSRRRFRDLTERLGGS